MTLQIQNPRFTLNSGLFCTFQPMFSKRSISVALALTLTLVQHAFSQGDPVGGARSAALGLASATLSDVWSAFNNQAGLADLENSSAGVFWENRFLMKELSTQGFAVAIPTKGGTFALSGTNFGYQLYREGQYAISYGRKLADSFNAGLQISYLTTRAGEGYGSTSAVAFQLGFIYELNEQVTLAAHAANPGRAPLSDYKDERYPTMLKAGASWKFSPKVSMLAEVAKDIDQDVAVRAGLEYRVIEKLYLRGGVGGNDLQTSFGIGLALDEFKIDIASAYHPTLGYSPQISMSYDVK